MKLQFRQHVVHIDLEEVFKQFVQAFVGSLLEKLRYLAFEDLSYEEFFDDGLSAVVNVGSEEELLIRSGIFQIGSSEVLVHLLNSGLPSISGCRSLHPLEVS